MNQHEERVNVQVFHRVWLNCSIQVLQVLQNRGTRNYCYSKWKIKPRSFVIDSAPNPGINERVKHVFLVVVPLSAPFIRYEPQSSMLIIMLLKTLSVGNLKSREMFELSPWSNQLVTKFLLDCSLINVTASLAAVLASFSYCLQRQKSIALAGSQTADIWEMFALVGAAWTVR